MTYIFAPSELSWETEKDISVSAAAHASEVVRHGSTTVRTNEFGPTNVDTTTPFSVKGLRVIVYTPTSESSVKVGVV